jgi:DNA-binding CsgD family transcriptional regulator/tetratricopeptide (TPR) repeat protein
LEDPRAAQHRLFRALAELLDRLKVAVLIIEDVHWADEATLEFLLFLTTSQPQRRCLLVTYRPEDVPDSSLLRRLSSRLPAGTACERISLGPLDVPEIADLVSSMLPGGRSSPEFASFLRIHTDGLPLAVEESVRLLFDRRDLRRQGGEWVRRHLDALVVPPTVRDAVLERAGRLGSPAQSVLQAAAVLAVPSAEPVLLAVSALETDASDRALTGCLECGLLTDDGPSGAGLISFRHALASLAVYEAMPAHQRRQMHLRAARALENQHTPPVAQLARHFRAAGETQPWARYAEQAADLALAACDDQAAAVLLYDLIIQGSLPASAVARLSRKIPPIALGGYAPVDTLVRHLRAVLDSGDLDPAQRADICWELGRILMDIGESAAAHAELECALPDLEHRPLDVVRAMLWLGSPGKDLLPAQVHRRWLARATGAATGLRLAARDQLTLTASLATGLLALGEEAGWTVSAGIPEDSTAVPEVLPVAIGCLNIGAMTMLWGRYNDARRRLTAALRLADQHDYLRVREGVLATMARLDWYTGTWDGLAERAAGLVHSHDAEPQNRMEAAMVAGMLDALAGDSQAARQRLSRVLDEQTRRGTVGSLYMDPVAAVARLCLADGHVEEVLALTGEPVDVIRAKGTWLWGTEVVPVRVQALVSSEQLDATSTLVSAFAEWVADRDAPASGAALAMCQAIVAQGRGEHDEAISLFARAADAWQALPRPYDALLARERQANCLLAAGRFDAGLALLADVHRGLIALGAAGDAHRVERALRDYGMKPWSGWRGGRRGYGDQLSPRELEVVRLVAVGLTTREIATELCRSSDTVYTQVRSAMRKLGVPSRTALAVRAAEAGLAARDSSSTGVPPAAQ